MKNLVDCFDPLQHDKELKETLSGIWKYRVDDYRMFAKIQDEVITIEIFEIAHRREIYK